ncbi:hypothetical protein [Paraburkholderia dinghuensis]|uniref:Uncharacterized protein n=1 Tax=Paraburkholderia dinghuensis TaxID=2305225 RepID=A0A3N6PT03_9BURK|nr:hypothetical protein [Paraburkholderia dinghuensis]RQH02726.1 hypothetical protein D1Y85_21575 [Paraburkholderia dinghuensis]
MPQNIEKFDLLTARLFADLYGRFPVRTFLSAESYGIDAEKVFQLDGKINAAVSAELEFFCATLRWLRESGYLDYKSEGNCGVFSDVVLTTRGLDVLKAMPKSVSPDKPLGDYLRDAVRSGTTDALKSGVAAALSAGAMFAWNTLTR